MTRPQDMDLSMAVVDDRDGSAIVALVEAVRRYGARSLAFGYSWPGHPEDAEPPSDAEGVTWWAEATYKLAGRKHVVRREVVAQPGWHHHAQVEALAELVRERGGNVVTVQR